MSSLSSKVRVVYVPALYDMDDQFIKEGGDFYDEEEAEREGANMVARYVSEHNKPCYCLIQKTNCTHLGIRR